MIHTFATKLRRFKKRQDGNATIEFVLLFPAFITLFLMGFESGYYMVRNVMLERAVDYAVRDVRLGNSRVDGFQALKQRICDEAAILPDCMRSVQVELQPVPRGIGAVDAMRRPTKCVDKDSDEDQAQFTTYTTGGDNQLMLVRVCALSQPLFPTTGLGVGMRRDAQGNYAIVATSSFVNEPGANGQGNGGSNGNGGGNGNGVN